MPGYASWKTIYYEEYRQLFEEGYYVGDNPFPSIQDEYLPLPPGLKEYINEDNISEAQWEEAYYRLWEVRNKGIRKDFSYNEPELYKDIIDSSDSLPELLPLTYEEYKNRIKGAWFGRCAAVILGKPLEMGMNRDQIKEYLESVNAYPLNDWVPIHSDKLGKTLRLDCLPSSKDNVQFVQPDDDIHYTILALLLAEKKGLDFSTLDVGMNWLDNVPYHWFWCASRQAYFHLVNLKADRPLQDQVNEIPLKLNPWRECIDGQLRGDFWGYITPCDPRAGAYYAYKDCKLSLVKNGIYGGMFVAGCISAALSSNPTIETILHGGLSVIPQKSRLAEAINTVISWYQHDKDWNKVCDKIYEHYGHLPFAGTINNLSLVVLALLHGNLDYSKTITTAVMSGMDTDCNSATAGSIVGAAIGYSELDPKWVMPLNDTVKTAIANFGQGTITDLIKRTIKVKMKYNTGKLLY